MVLSCHRRAWESMGCQLGRHVVEKVGLDGVSAGVAHGREWLGSMGGQLGAMVAGHLNVRVEGVRRTDMLGPREVLP